MAGSAPRLDRSDRVDLNGAGTVIALGERTYTVVPQKIGRLRSQLGVQIQTLSSLTLEEGSSFDDVLGEGMERVHALLLVFIPDLMPVHEFCGFSTREAFEANEYHEASDHGPDLAQLRVAFETCMKVNSLDLLGHLKNVFGPDLIRAVIQEQVLGTVLTAASPKGPSTSTSSTSGPESLSTPSTTTPPTSAESAV